MANNVIPFQGKTLNDISTDTVLEAAKGKLRLVVVLGYDEHGNEYYASSTGETPLIAWLLDSLKNNLLNGIYDE